MADYRKIWEQTYGKIPVDCDGRTFEIHHLDGDSDNNEISNLKCLSIKEHYELHLKQGDFGAAAMIAKRMGLPPNHLSEIQKGVKRPGVGGAKKGRTPWNKNKQNCFNENTITKWKEKRKGTIHSRKLSAEDVKKNKKKYTKKKNLQFETVGKPRPNGILMTYERALSKHLGEIFNVTETCIHNVLLKKSFKNEI